MRNEIEETCGYCLVCPASNWDYEKTCTIDLFQKTLTIINELESENKELRVVTDIANERTYRKKFTDEWRTDNNREEVEKKLQEMIQKDREFVCKNGVSCKKTGENTLVKMAKFIMQTGEDYCTKCCVDFKACNERLKGDESKLPPEETCIRNIIKFFEK